MTAGPWDAALDPTWHARQQPECHCDCPVELVFGGRMVRHQDGCDAAERVED